MYFNESHAYDVGNFKNRTLGKDDDFKDVYYYCSVFFRNNFLYRPAKQVVGGYFVFFTSILNEINYNST